MKALIQEGGKDVIFNIDPNQSPDAKPIADMCKAAGVYFVTQWNKPDDLHPWDYDPYWVCHMGVDGVPSGYYIAQELFKARWAARARSWRCRVCWPTCRPSSGSTV